MFTCKQCLDKAEGKGHFEKHTLGLLGISYGRCEVCGKTKEYVDCKCYKGRAN